MPNGQRHKKVKGVDSAGGSSSVSAPCCAAALRSCTRMAMPWIRMRQKVSVGTSLFVTLFDENATASFSCAFSATAGLEPVCLNNSAGLPASQSHNLKFVVLLCGKCH